MTKIDDAAVARAKAHLRMEVRGYAWDRGHRGEYNESFTPTEKQIRAALEAALQPPEEIPVSEAMIDAGLAVAARGVGGCWLNPSEIYRAMESARRAEASKCKVCGGKPKPWYAMPCGFCPPADRSHNRRKDDPK